MHVSSQFFLLVFSWWSAVDDDGCLAGGAEERRCPRCRATEVSAWDLQQRRTRGGCLKGGRFCSVILQMHLLYILASVGRNVAIIVREKMLTKPKGSEDDWGMCLLYQLYPLPWHRDMIRMSHSFQSYVRIRGRQHPPGRAWTPQAEHRWFKALASDLHEPSAERKSIGTMT